MKTFFLAIALVLAAMVIVPAPFMVAAVILIGLAWFATLSPKAALVLAVLAAIAWFVL